METEERTLMETLTEEQQMQVMNLMSIANIEDMNFAAQMLTQFNFDLDKAAEKMLEIQSGLSPTLKKNMDLEVEGKAIHGQKGNESPKANADLRMLYRKHLEKKMAQEADNQNPLKNIYSGVKNFFSSINPISAGEGSGEQFLKYFRENYEDLNKLMKFNKGNFEENVHKACDYKKPMLVYIHVDNQDNQVIPPIVFTQEFINYTNTKFYLFGVLAGSEAAKPFNKYVNVKDKSCLAVFRMNLLDDIQLMESFSLVHETDVSDLIEKLRDVEGSFYLLMSEEDKIKTEVKRSVETRRQAQMETYQNYDDPHYQEFENYDIHSPGIHHPQPSGFMADQQKLEDDRLLRQLQEEEFKEVERKIRDKQIKEMEEESIKRQKEEEEQELRALKNQEKQRLEEEKKMVEQQKKEQLQLKLANLPQEPSENEPDVITIAFRLPSGNRIERRFKSSNKIQTLYDYIDTQDIPFDKATQRYDLIQPRPFLCLDDKEKTLNNYFEGSSQELIHIREHSS